MKETLFYREIGSGGPVCIILHGLLGSGENWQNMAKQLSRYCRVFTPDLRNHGNSFHSSDFGYPEMAWDVKGLIEKIGEGGVTVIGHSMGGKVGMELALSHPSLVKRLVIADISPFRYTPAYANVFTGLVNLPVSKMKYRSEADRNLEKSIPDRLLRLFLLKNLVRNEKGTFYWRVNLKALSENYFKIWDKIDTARSFSGPVLFLEGELSNAEIAPRLEEIREIFPGAEYSLVEGAGHWIHSDKPDIFFEKLRDFLDF